MSNDSNDDNSGGTIGEISADEVEQYIEDYIEGFIASGLVRRQRAPQRVPLLTGQQWMMQTLGNAAQCSSMFRMRPDQVILLDDILQHKYNLTASYEVSTLEAVGIFLWIMSGGEANRRANNRFERSGSTISKYFNRVLHAVTRMARDIVRPVDPTFSSIHPRLLTDNRYLQFYNSIGAIDGTHVQVIVPSNLTNQYRNRVGETTQNVLVISDWSDCVIFDVAGWPGSVHDHRVLLSAMSKYPDRFPRPPPGKYFLVDKGYANRQVFLAPYPEVRYWQPQFDQAAPPEGREENFNFYHSSLRGSVE